jgi:hypothetical protein
MRIIFDQATPVPIRQYLERHTVRTAAQQGWDKLTNGDLPTAVEEARFDRRIAIVVIGHRPRLRLEIQRVVEAVNRATPGSYVEVEIPK